MAELIKGLDIHSLVHGGRGLGHHEGRAVFVPLTAPGDRIACRVTRAKSRFLEAELVELLEASPLRREPPCPFFGSCGGCQWQHLPYSVQLDWKQRTFADQMVRAKVAETECLRPIQAAAEEWRYRNRVQFKCHQADGRLVVGFYRHASHYVVDVDECRLVSAGIQRALSQFREASAGIPLPECVPQLDLACGDDGDLRIVLHALPEGRRQLHAWLEGFARNHRLNACIQSGRKDSLELVHGTGELVITVDQPQLALRYGPGGFAQVNSPQNRAMVAAMVDLLSLRGTEQVLDLFCGMGNFSLPAARRAGHVTGVEDYPPSIDSALSNAAANGIDNVAFHADDAARVMARFRPGDLDLVILDPPRTGHYQAVRQLLELRPGRILYVSCDPATLVRDLLPLVHGGYRVVASQPFDLFPQTWHIESMTLLQRTGR